MGCYALEELDVVATNKSAQHYQKDQFIYQEGNQPLGLYCVYEGRIKLSKAGGDNKEQIVHLARQGDALGYRSLIAGNRYTVSAVALEDCVVCLVPRPDFLRLVQANVQFSAALMQQLAHSLDEAEEQMLQLAYKPVRERLAGALVLVQQTNINPETAAAYNTEVVKQKQKAISAPKLGGETIEDILITLTNQLHLLKLNAAGNKFIYLVVNSRETNLAIARAVLRSHVATMS